MGICNSDRDKLQLLLPFYYPALLIIHRDVWNSEGRNKDINNNGKAAQLRKCICINRVDYFVYFSVWAQDTSWNRYRESYWKWNIKFETAV